MAKKNDPEETGADSATPVEVPTPAPVAAPVEKTDDQKLDEDIAGFNVDLKAALQKYDLALTGEPMLLPSDDGGYKLFARPIVVRAPKSASKIIT